MLDKDKIKEGLTIDDIREIVKDLGSPEPKDYSNGVLIFQTICHGGDSMKLYYYDDTKLFKCYTHCGESFDIFELIIKVFSNNGEDITLPAAMYYVSNKFKLTDSEFRMLKDKELEELKSILDYKVDTEEVVLIEHETNVLDAMPFYRVLDWEEEGITEKSMKKFGIKYHPGSAKIVIPHYDSNMRLVGIRGRTLFEQDIEKYGKYMPLVIADKMYNHPLGMNLYGLGENKENIQKYRKVIIVESEKSVLLGEEYMDGNLVVAVCGSNVSAHQVRMILKLGVEEVVLAFDKQYKEIMDEEFVKWRESMIKFAGKFQNYCNISIVCDTEGLLNYKDSPLDKGKEVWYNLLDKRHFLRKEEN